jgi:uncharacterized protein DUF4255
MPNALALAAVTAVLRDLLNDGLINHSVSAALQFEVTVQPPDLLAGSTEGPSNRLNLYLYRTTPNPGWSNVRYPSRNSAGERCSNPYLALDLHYLLSAHSNENFNAEVMLGFGQQALHDTPVLDRDQIRNSLSAPLVVDGGILPAAFQTLSAAELADQIEQIKISPQTISLEETSQLWSAVNSPMRMFALYMVSVVLIESTASTRSSLPVRRRDLFVRQLKRPRINRLLSRALPADEPTLNRPIVHGDQVMLEGSGLRGDITTLQIGEEEVTPAVADLTDRSVAALIPATLHPGMQGVQVVHRIGKEPPSVEEMPWERSNLVAFVLLPTLASVNPIQIVSSSLEDNNDLTGPVRGTIRISFDHNVGAGQQMRLSLNETPVPVGRQAFAYSFGPVSLTPGVEEVTERDFEFEGVQQAEYLLRVSVDGAETQLSFNGTEYDAPTLVIAAP